MLRRSGHGESAGSRLHHVQHVGVQNICRTSRARKQLRLHVRGFAERSCEPNSAHASHRSCLEAAGETMTDIPEQLPGNGDYGPGDGNIPAEPETTGRVRPDETASQIALAIQPDLIALSVIWWMTMGRGCVERRG